MLTLFACAVCGAGADDPSRGSYITMSIIISLLPLGMIGGVITWLVLSVRAASAAQKMEDAGPRA